MCKQPYQELSEQTLSVDAFLTEQASDTTDKEDNLQNIHVTETTEKSQDELTDPAPTETDVVDSTDMVKDVTLSQSYLFRQGVGIAKSVNANIFNLAIPNTTPLDVSTNTTVYLSVCDEAKSFPDLLAKMVNRVITPLLFLKGVRNTIAKKITPEVSFEMKLKLGFLWLCLNSKESYLAPKLHAYNSMLIHSGVVCM